MIPAGVFIPALRVSFSFQRVVLSWPVDAANFVPEACTLLGANPAWSALTNAPSTNGLNLLITDRPGSGNRF